MWCSKKIDFLSVDVEGAEIEVLKGSIMLIMNLSIFWLKVEK